MSRLITRDIDALLQTLGIRQLPVVGHSLGALVALALAASFPTRVAALALLDPPLDPEIENPEIEMVYRLRRAPAGELERALAFPALAPVFRQAADQAFEALLAAPRGAPWAWTAAANITVPTLLVQADPAQGGVLGDRAAREFAARLPQAHLLHIPGAGHAVQATHPELLAQALREFLEAE